MIWCSWTKSCGPLHCRCSRDGLLVECAKPMDVYTTTITNTMNTSYWMFFPIKLVNLSEFQSRMYCLSMFKIFRKYNHTSAQTGALLWLLQFGIFVARFCLILDIMLSNDYGLETNWKSFRCKFAHFNSRMTNHRFKVFYDTRTRMSDHCAFDFGNDRTVS